MFLGVDVNLIATPNTEILLSGLSIPPVVFVSLPSNMATHLVVHRRSAGSSNCDVSRTPVWQCACGINVGVGNVGSNSTQ
jgi:hypothetical protein